MNQDLFFWKSWRPTDRRLYWGILLLLGVVLVVYLVQYFIGADAVIRWQVQNEAQDISFDIDSFTKGIFNFKTQAQSFLLVEWFEASVMQINTLAVSFYGVCVALGMVLLVSGVTFLPRWWYLGSMMVCIGVLAGLQLEVLQIWGFVNAVVFGISLVVLIPVSYYFHAFRPDISFHVRLVVFAVLVGLLLFMWIYFAQTPKPVMSLLSYGTRGFAFLTIVFILINAHEIPSHLLILVTRTGIATGPNSIFHFTVITGFYLANLVISYMKGSGLIEWNLLYINAFYLLIVSVVLGVMGFHRRVSDVVSNPYSSIIYAGWAMVSLATVGFAFATGNDPMMDAFEDTITYSHLAMGVAFYLYVFVNFRGPMTQGLAIYKVMFQPRLMPFGLAFALTGLIMLMLLLKVSMFPFDQGVAGYNNYLGDLYFAEGNDVLAESYYKKGLLFQSRNHKSNYALASLARRNNNAEAAAAFLREAIANKPTPHTYGALSQLYAQEDLYFDALFALKEGTRKFPESGELWNNLAVMYSRTSVLDSAYLSYVQAMPRTRKPEVVQTNLLAMLAKKLSPTQLDSILTNTPHAAYPALENNRLAICNLLNKKDTHPYMPAKDTLLTRAAFAYLYNYVLNHKTDSDTTALHAINETIQKPYLPAFNNYLKFAKAVQLYHTHHTREAFDVLKEAEQNSDYVSANYNEVLGMWYLQQDVPTLAAYRFEKAVSAGDSLNKINYAFALTRQGKLPEATQLWDNLRISSYPQARGVAQTMSKVAHYLIQPGIDSLTDAEKVAVVYYSPQDNLVPLVSTIQDISYRASALLYLAESHLTHGNTTGTESDLRALQALAITDTIAKKTIRELERKVLWQKQDWTGLATALKGASSRYQAFYQAEIDSHTGKMAEAEKNYQRAMQTEPFDDRLTLAIVDFYNRQKNPEKAYEMLTHMLQLNSTSVTVQKAYIMQCLNLSFTEYAAHGMEQLQSLAPADYQAFVPQYEAKRALIEKKLAEWK